MPSKLTTKDKQQLIIKSYGVFAQNGISKTSTDELTRQLGISKGTLYKYWKGKAALVEQILEGIQQNMHFDGSKRLHSIDDVLENLQELFNLAIIHSTSVSNGFLAETKLLYPDLYQKHTDYFNEETEKSITFFMSAANLGFFRPTNFRLVSTLLHSTLPVIVDKTYIIDNELTLTGVLKDFYKLLLHELVSSEYTHLLDRDSSYLFINQLVKKLNL